MVPKADDRFVLNLGDQNWPFPIPIVKKDGAWFFDTAAGREEIINRRIGEDEMTTIGVCRTYLAAQREYASEDRDGDGVLKFAQKIHSAPGRKDGLYWPAAPGEDPSPFGPFIAEVHAEGYGGRTAEGTPQPFHGYRFRILTAQGASAPGGAYSYVINGNMIAGFALVAYPAHWGESGVMTFIVNQWGKVYECNLGPRSADFAAEMNTFDPDHGRDVALIAGCLAPTEPDHRVRRKRRVAAPIASTVKPARKARSGPMAARPVFFSRRFLNPSTA
jgi:hypothetical protein